MPEITTSTILSMCILNCQKLLDSHETHPGVYNFWIHVPNLLHGLHFLIASIVYKTKIEQVRAVLMSVEC